MMTCPHLRGKFKFENLKSTLNGGTKACIRHQGDFNDDMSTLGREIQIWKNLKSTLNDGTKACITHQWDFNDDMSTFGREIQTWNQH